MSIVSLEFEVVRKYAQSSEKVIAKFSDEKDARIFMQEKAILDSKLKLETAYFLRHFDEFLGEPLKSTDINPERYHSTDQSTQTGAASTSSFNPSPFSTTAQPPGMKSSFTHSKQDNHDDDI